MQFLFKNLLKPTANLKMETVRALQSYFGWLVTIHSIILMHYVRLRHYYRLTFYCLYTSKIYFVSGASRTRTKITTQNFQ